MDSGAININNGLVNIKVIIIPLRTLLITKFSNTSNVSRAVSIFTFSQHVNACTSLLLLLEYFLMESITFWRIAF